MNYNKYKYFDKLFIIETKSTSYGFYDVYDDENYDNFIGDEYYFNSKYFGYYYDWLYDEGRLRDIKIDEILYDNIDTFKSIMPKSLFR